MNDDQHTRDLERMIVEMDRIIKNNNAIFDHIKADLTVWLLMAFTAGFVIALVLVKLVRG